MGSGLWAWLEDTLKIEYVSVRTYLSKNRIRVRYVSYTLR